MTHLLQKIPRNTLLLMVLLVLFIAAPAVSDAGDFFILELMFNGVLIAGVYTAGTRKPQWGFWLLTTVTLAYRWSALLFGGERTISIGALVLTLLWLVAAVWIIVPELFKKQHVTVDTIFGAVVAYLLSAVAFAITFEIIEVRNPGSFAGLPDGASASRWKLVATMMYFSLICITTVGFGDIVPESAIAKPIAALEGMFGQLYLAVMIARLVGMHLASTDGA
jgi:hypothetical protein